MNWLEAGWDDGSCVQQAGVGTAQRMLGPPVLVSGQAGETSP